jgi:hypothetical protein
MNFEEFIHVVGEFFQVASMEFFYAIGLGWIATWTLLDLFWLGITGHTIF